MNHHTQSSIGRIRCLLTHGISFCAVTAMLSETQAQEIASELSGGGGQSRSVDDSIVVDSMVGTFGGIALLPSPVDIEVAVPTPLLPEASQIQLQAFLRLDDGTLSPLAADRLQWGGTGSVVSISPEGIATTAAVINDSTGGIGAFHHMTTNGTVGENLATEFQLVTVVDSQPDNFVTAPYDFAGDGLPDGWQATHYDLGSPQAAPEADSDGDSQATELEYFFNSDPTDGASRGRLEFMVSEGPDETPYFFMSFLRRQTLSPGWSYRPQFSDTLSAEDWDTTPIRTDHGGDVLLQNGESMVRETWRSIHPVNESPGRGFLRLRVERPD